MCTINNVGVKTPSKACWIVTSHDAWPRLKHVWYGFTEVVGRERDHRVTNIS